MTVTGKIIAIVIVIVMLPPLPLLPQFPLQLLVLLAQPLHHFCAAAPLASFQDATHMAVLQELEARHRLTEI